MFCRIEQHILLLAIFRYRSPSLWKAMKLFIHLASALLDGNLTKEQIGNKFLPSFGICNCNLNTPSEWRQQRGKCVDMNEKFIEPLVSCFQCSWSSSIKAYKKNKKTCRALCLSLHICSNQTLNKVETNLLFMQIIIYLTSLIAILIKRHLQTRRIWNIDLKMRKTNRNAWEILFTW